MMLSLSDKHLRGHLEPTSVPASSQDDVINVLELQFNFVTSISPALLARFCNLTTLNFGGNELTEIPDLHCVARLRELFLNNNKIEVAETLEYLRELRLLDLRANRLRHVDHLGCSPTLTRLSLSCNQLTRLPAAPFPHVVFLSVFGNRIDTPDPILALLARCPTLEEAILSGNLCWPTVQDVHREQARIRAVAPSLRQLDWALLPR